MSYIKLFTTELNNKGLSLYDKAVYGSLMTKFQYHHNTEFYTFEKFIADELEVSERTVKRSIKRLADEGLISINKRFHKQLKQTVNYYIINNSILSNENLASDTSTTASEKVEQKPNNGTTNGNEYEQKITELNAYINELTEANDWLQSEVERLENKPDDVDDTPNYSEVQKNKLEQAIRDYHNYMGDDYYLQDYFENWSGLNDVQKEGICGCLGDISMDELRELYRTWKRVA